MADLTNQRVAHEPNAVTATFMFADIAGFTALTEAHGDDDAAKLVADFCDAVKSELAAFGGVQIKAIGDALMLRIADPENTTYFFCTLTCAGAFAQSPERFIG
jgi:class 3 adenylate cyclase